MVNSVRLRDLVFSAMLLSLAGAPVSPLSVNHALVLTGSDGRSVMLSAVAVAAVPRVAITFDVHGVSQAYDVPLLSDVLKTAGAPTREDLRGPALAQVILATAAVGYQVAYGLAETDPGIRPNRIILADRADGAPLGPDATPFQIIVEGDLRPARSKRQAGTLRSRSRAVSPDPQVWTSAWRGRSGRDRLAAPRRTDRPTIPSRIPMAPRRRQACFQAAISAGRSTSNTAPGSWVSRVTSRASSASKRD